MWVEVDGGVAADLRYRACICRSDWATRGHRLERRQSETLVQAREDQACCCAVERSELLCPYLAEALNALGKRPERLQAAAGENQAQIG